MGLQWFIYLCVYDARSPVVAAPIAPAASPSPSTAIKDGRKIAKKATEICRSDTAILSREPPLPTCKYFRHPNFYLISPATLSPPLPKTDYHQSVENRPQS